MYFNGPCAFCQVGYHLSSFTAFSRGNVSSCFSNKSVLPTVTITVLLAFHIVSQNGLAFSCSWYQQERFLRVVMKRASIYKLPTCLTMGYHQQHMCKQKSSNDQVIFMNRCDKIAQKITAITNVSFLCIACFFAKKKSKGRKRSLEAVFFRFALILSLSTTQQHKKNNCVKQ